MSRVKRLLTVTLSVIMLLSAALPAAVYADSPVRVTVNGKEVVWTDAAPFINSDGRTMVPLRAVGEALGLYVIWDAAAKVAVFSRFSEFTSRGYQLFDIKQLNFPVGAYHCDFYAQIGIDEDDSDDLIVDKYLELGGNYHLSTDGIGRIKMDTATVIVNGRTYAPIRYLAEYFGYKVEWDPASRTVLITGEPKADSFGEDYPGLYAYLDQVMGNDLLPDSARIGEIVTIPAQLTACDGIRAAVNTGSIFFEENGYARERLSPAYPGAVNSADLNDLHYGVYKNASGLRIIMLGLDDEEKSISTIYRWVEVPETDYWVLFRWTSGQEFSYRAGLYRAGEGQVTVALTDLIERNFY